MSTNEKDNEKRVFELASKILTYEFFGGKCDEIVKESEEIRKIESELYNRKILLKKKIKENLALSKRLKKVVPKEDKSKLKQSLREIKNVKKMTLNPGGRLMRYLLGHTNDIFMSGGLQQKFQYKTEYENMKYRLTIVNIIFTIFVYFVPQNSMLDVIYRLFFFYVYVTLILREDVLRINGSRIGTWWSIHHYLSCAIAIITLTWTAEDVLFLNYKKCFIYFNLFNCCIQVLQFYYQMRRLYVARSMGKASTVDVINSETASSLRVNREGMGFLIILIPLLLFDIGLLFFYGGWLMFDVVANYSQSGINPTWQSFATSCLFVILGMGNLMSLTKVIIKKLPGFKRLVQWRKKRKENSMKKDAKKDAKKDTHWREKKEASEKKE